MTTLRTTILILCATLIACCFQQISAVGAKIFPSRRSSIRKIETSPGSYQPKQVKRRSFTDWIKQKKAQWQQQKKVADIEKKMRRLTETKRLKYTPQQMLDAHRQLDLSIDETAANPQSILARQVELIRETEPIRQQEVARRVQVIEQTKGRETAQKQHAQIAADVGAEDPNVNTIFKLSDAAASYATLTPQERALVQQANELSLSTDIVRPFHATAWPVPPTEVAQPSPSLFMPIAEKSDAVQPTELYVESLDGSPGPVHSSPQTPTSGPVRMP